MTCLLLYWPKIHNIFVNFSFFLHWVSFFLFSSIKIINVIYDKKRKKRSFHNVFGRIFFAVFGSHTLKTSVLLLYVKYDSNFLGIWSVYF